MSLMHSKRNEWAQDYVTVSASSSESPTRLVVPLRKKKSLGERIFGRNSSSNSSSNDSNDSSNDNKKSRRGKAQVKVVRMHSQRRRQQQLQFQQSNHQRQQLQQALAKKHKIGRSSGRSHGRHGKRCQSEDNIVGRLPPIEEDTLSVGTV